MASRQTSGTLSTNQYASGPAQSSAQAQQQDINLSNQSLNPKLVQMNSGGRGTSNTASSQILPILPQNASPGVNGLTSVITTGTVNLGTPHGLALGSSGQTFTLSQAALGGYNCTACTIVSVPTNYSFTYTLANSGSGLAASGSGQVSLLGGSVAALINYSPVINGLNIAGSTTGPLEIWSDNALWDTTNSRYISPQVAGLDPANMQ